MKVHLSLSAGWTLLLLLLSPAAELCAAAVAQLPDTCMTSLSDAQVAPSIAVVRLVYETLIQTWGTGGVHRYREAAQKPG